MPQHDEHDDLSALDFSAHQSGSDDDGHDESHALDFSATAEAGEDSEVEALYDYAPTEPEEAPSELDAIAAATEASDEEEEEGAQEYTVTNPPETVSVTALIDGRTQRVKLSATATKLSESELGEEIVVLAELARQKGLAGQLTLLTDNASQIEGLDGLAELGVDSNLMLREMMQSGMKLPTPEEADAAQTEVFAARYTPDK